MGGELPLNPIRISHWPVTISFLIKNNFLNSGPASFFCSEYRVQLLCIFSLNSLHQRINSRHTEYNSCYWNSEGLISLPPHLTWQAAYIFQMNLKVRASCRKSRGQDGWATLNLWSFVLKGRQEGDSKLPGGPNSLCIPFLSPSTKHLFSARHSIRTIWHGHAAIRKTPPQKRKDKGTLHCWRR